MVEVKKKAEEVKTPTTAKQKKREKYTKILETIQADTHYHSVLKYMLDKGSITSYEAFAQLGNTRLSATIYTLRNTFGVNIASREVSKKKGDKTIRFAQYYLI